MIQTRMKVVLFAGGAAKRLARYIGTYNKHLIPVGKTLVIENGVRELITAGATEFLVVTNSGWEDAFRELFKERLRLAQSQFTVVSSKSPNLPLPDVLLQAEAFVGNHPFLLYLGDNLFLDSPVPIIRSIFHKQLSTLVLTLSDEPSHFGVVRFRRDNGLVDCIEEKPHISGCHWVVTGLARYTPEVFAFARKAVREGKPARSLSDLNNRLLKSGKLGFQRWYGSWFDIGTPERYSKSLVGMWNSLGELKFDLEFCPRPDLLKSTLLAQDIDKFAWEIRHGRFK